LHSTPIKVEEIVLLHNTIREKDMSREQKMYFRWLGPYRVKKIITLKEAYVLEELNDEELRDTIAENRLKRFYLKSEV
jgi:ribosomal protein S28E/S33